MTLVVSRGGAPGVREVLWRWGAWVTGDPLAAQRLDGRTDLIGALRHLLRVAGSSAPSDARCAAFLHDGARLDVGDVAAVLGCDEDGVHRLVARGRLEEAPPSAYLGPCATVRLGALVQVDREALNHALTCRECADARSSLRAGRRAVVTAWDGAGAALADAVVPVSPMRHPTAPQPLAPAGSHPRPAADQAGPRGAVPPPARPRVPRRRRFPLRSGRGSRVLAVLAGLPVLALVISGPWPSPGPTPTAPSMRMASAAVASSPVAAEEVVGDEDVWARLAACQSFGDWTADTGNGYYGGLQFSIESWRLVGGAGLPHQAPPHEQIRRARLLHDLQGWSAWPVCAARLSLVS